MVSKEASTGWRSIILWHQKERYTMQAVSSTCSRRYIKQFLSYPNLIQSLQPNIITKQSEYCRKALGNKSSNRILSSKTLNQLSKASWFPNPKSTYYSIKRTSLTSKVNSNNNNNAAYTLARCISPKLQSLPSSPLSQSPFHYQSSKLIKMVWPTKH